MSTLFVIVCMVWMASELWLGWHRRSTDSKRTRDGGTLLLLMVAITACIALGVWLAFRRWLPFPAGLEWPLIWIGMAMMIAGMAFRFWAVRVLAEYFTVDVTIRPGHRLVRDGPYRWLRHPSYTGALTTFCGFALCLGDGLALLAVIVPITAAFLWRIRTEEHVLADAFPDQYPAYARVTKRLIPYVW